MFYIGDALFYSFYSEFNTNLQNRNSNFRRDVHDIFIASLQDFIDDHINDEYFEHSRKDEDISSLAAGTKLYGVLSTGAEGFKGYYGETTTINKVSLLKLIKAGLVVPEASGKGYKQHFLRAAIHSFIHFTAHQSLSYDPSSKFSILGALTVNNSLDTIVKSFYANMLGFARMGGGLSLCKEKFEPFTDLQPEYLKNKEPSISAHKLDKWINFIKSTAGWMANDQLVVLNNVRNSHKSSYDTLSTSEECNVTDIYFNGLELRLLNRLQKVARSAKMYLSSAYTPDSERSNKTCLDKTAMFENVDTDYRIPALVYLLAPGLVIDVVTVMAELLADFRNKVHADKVDEKEMFDRYSQISKWSPAYVDPILGSMRTQHSFSYNYYSSRQLASHEENLNLSTYIEGCVQTGLNQKFCKGYYRYLPFYKTKQIIYTITGTDPKDFNKEVFIKYWDKLQQDPELAFDLDYRKPRKSGKDAE